MCNDGKSWLWVCASGWVFERLQSLMRTGLGSLLCLLLAVEVAMIDQSCSTTAPCPANANCIGSNSMCACNSGFIGNCNTPATAISTTPITASLTSGQTALFYMVPNQLNNYIEFTFTICVNGPQIFTVMTLWGETGDTSSYSPVNSLGNPTSATLYSGCQQLSTPYISFSTQPNGQSQMLVLGIADNSQSTTIQISVSQQVIIGVFIYYYILIALVAIVAVVIIVGISIFIYRQRMRRRAAAMQPAIGVPLDYNNIEHFQNFMPIFAADKLGPDRSVCPICLMQIELAEVVRQTPCKHNFHSTCIDSWCLKNLTCPVCRTDLSQPSLDQQRRSSPHVGHIEGWEEHHEPEVYIKPDEFVVQREVARAVAVEVARKVEEPSESVRGLREENSIPNITFDQNKYEIREHML